LKLGKWAESKIVFKDTSTGKRGVTRSPATLANYLKVYMGKINVPASSAAGTGGSVRVLKATHGLDTIIGAIANIVNKSNTSSIHASIVNASTLLLTLPGYTAATANFDAVIWGTSSV